MDPVWIEYGAKIVLVLLLVAANGFFVASEFALVGVRKTRVEMLARTGNRRARRLKNVLGTLDAYISATQLGITIASLSLGWVGEETIARMLEPVFERITPGIGATLASESIAIAVAFLIITFLHIVLGELAPKTLALERTEGVALSVALPMELFYRAFKAPIWLLNKAGNVVVRAVGLTATAEHAAVYTEDELRHLVEISHRSGHLNAGERELIDNVFEFADETVRDCLVPRTEVVAAEADTTTSGLVEIFRASSYSRIPVYEGTLDAVIGVAYARDALSAALDRIDVRAREIARPALYVPPSAQLDDVLARMKRTGHHMAAVVDEHGGFEGIITLEDLLEEIVGDIADEFDEQGGEPIAAQADGSYLVDASAPVRVVNRTLELELPESGQYATLAGYLLAQTGSIPRQGVVIRAAGHEFTVESMRRNRIGVVRLRPGRSINDEASEVSDV